MSALVVLSGGADSTICLHDALRTHTKVRAVVFSYGQANTAELFIARNVANAARVPMRVFHVDWGQPLLIELKDMRSIQGRNTMLLTLAALHAQTIGADHLYFGCCAEDTMADSSSAFVESLQRTFDAASMGVTLVTPLRNMTKAQTILHAQSIGCFDALSRSWSCYLPPGPDGKPCGECMACTKRAAGFAAAGLQDPLFKESP